MHFSATWFDRNLGKNRQRTNFTIRGQILGEKENKPRDQQEEYIYLEKWMAHVGHAVDSIFASIDLYPRETNYLLYCEVNWVKEVKRTNLELIVQRKTNNQRPIWHQVLTDFCLLVVSTQYISSKVVLAEFLVIYRGMGLTKLVLQSCL